jgi:hypothetical protein
MKFRINRGKGRLSEKISLLKHQSKIVKSKIFLGNLWCPIQSVADYFKGRLSEGNLWCPIQSVADYFKGRLSEGNLWCPRSERGFL